MPATSIKPQLRGTTIETATRKCRNVTAMCTDKYGHRSTRSLLYRVTSERLKFWHHMPLGGILNLKRTGILLHKSHTRRLLQVHHQSHSHAHISTKMYFMPF